jgi:hypothetical protein
MQARRANIRDVQFFPGFRSALAPASLYRVHPWTRTAYIPVGVRSSSRPAIPGFRCAHPGYVTVLRGVMRQVLARISHRPGRHSDFGEDSEHKADGKGWAGLV